MHHSGARQRKELDHVLGDPRGCCCCWCGILLRCHPEARNGICGAQEPAAGTASRPTRSWTRCPTSIVTTPEIKIRARLGGATDDFQREYRRGNRDGGNGNGNDNDNGNDNLNGNGNDNGNDNLNDNGLFGHLFGNLSQEPTTSGSGKVSRSITARSQSELYDSWKAMEDNVEEEQPLQGEFLDLLNRNMVAMKLNQVNQRNGPRIDWFVALCIFWF